MRLVTTWTGDKTFKMGAWGRGPEGKEVKTMEMVVTKKWPSPLET